MPTVDVLNPALADKPIKKHEGQEVPYPSNEAKKVADRIYGNSDRSGLEDILFDIDDTQKRNHRELKVKGDLPDKIHHSLSQMGFKLRSGYEQKPKHMVNANTDSFDVNKPFIVITWS